MKVSVLAFDLSDNAIGRAELLARLLQPRYEVAIIGPRFGPEVWKPVTTGPIDHRAVPGRRYPRFAMSLPSLLALVDGDLIYASKPRPTSYGVGLLARARRRRPLLLDVDDWELGFFQRGGLWGRVGRALNLTNPNGLPWTWWMERLIGAADAVTVASRFLEGRFGGTLIPHARDTTAWDPARYDRAEARALLRVVGAQRVVMFLGTPRGHKGVDDLVEAVGTLGAGVVLALVGVAPARSGARRWESLPWVRLVGEIAFDEVPRYLVGADVVAVPQRATPDTVAQVPAKLFDAMALGRPIVSTTVSMIPEVLDGCGIVIPPGDARALAEALRALLADRDTAEALGRRARERCVEEYSFDAVRTRLYPLVEAVAPRDPRA
ncbi:MAG: glycosyltransferase [Candidatus Rokubacteria bacterium]|nr:glycosyltransferase [Candidatus Rokubacteria bacterium]